MSGTSIHYPAPLILCRIIRGHSGHAASSSQVNRDRPPHTITLTSQSNLTATDCPSLPLLRLCRHREHARPGTDRSWPSRQSHSGPWNHQARVQGTVFQSETWCSDVIIAQKTEAYYYYFKMSVFAVVLKWFMKGRVKAAPCRHLGHPHRSLWTHHSWSLAPILKL